MSWPFGKQRRPVDHARDAGANSRRSPSPPGTGIVGGYAAAAGDSLRRFGQLAEGRVAVGQDVAKAFSVLPAKSMITGRDALDARRSPAPPRGPGACGPPARTGRSRRRGSVRGAARRRRQGLRITTSIPSRSASTSSSARCFERSYAVLFG